MAMLEGRCSYDDDDDNDNDYDDDGHSSNLSTLGGVVEATNLNWA